MASAQLRIMLLAASAALGIAISLQEALSQTCAQCKPTPSFGVTVDVNGNVWVASGGTSNSVTKFAPNGTKLGTFPAGGNDCDYGIAVTPVDNHVWIASAGCKDEIGSSPDDVTRLRSDGTVCEVIGVNSPYLFSVDAPTGVAVDSAGDVWVTHRSIPNQQNPLVKGKVTRIHPGTGTNVSQILQTVDLGDPDEANGIVHPLGNSGPLNMTDMTGMVTLMTSGAGTWTTVHDGGKFGARWARAIWNTECTTQPPGTSLVVSVRAADRLLDLPAMPYLEVQSGALIPGVFGRYIEVRARFHGSRPGDGTFATPVLCDLTITGQPATYISSCSAISPAGCERDCNRNGAADICDLITSDPDQNGVSTDCNENDIPDECEIPVDPTSTAPGAPFYCNAFCNDCNNNKVPDDCDIDGSSNDCSGNGIPDECEPDCQPNGVADSCDIAAGTSTDCNGNGIPDSCETPITGACCDQMTQDCVVTTHFCCRASGGVYLGDNLECDELTALLCQSGACCSANGDCTDTTTIECMSTFLGYGSSCLASCCTQETPRGADLCSSAQPILVTIPDYEVETVLTVPGDNTSASLYDCPQLSPDPVWWERIEVKGLCSGSGASCFDDGDCTGAGSCVGSCAVLTIDDGCSPRPLTPYYTVLFDRCPCGVGIPADEVNTDPAVFSASFSLTWTLGTGVYYYPIYSGHDALRGPYQLHLTAKQCIPAVCCLGSSCDDTMNLHDCREAGGTWLGALDPPVSDCYFCNDGNPKSMSHS